MAPPSWRLPQDSHAPGFLLCAGLRPAGGCDGAARFLRARFSLRPTGAAGLHARCFEIDREWVDGQPVLYMALELLEGINLSTRLKKQGALTLEEALRVTQGVLIRKAAKAPTPSSTKTT